MRFIARVLTVAIVLSYTPMAQAQSNWVTIVSPTAGQSLNGRTAEVSVSYYTGSTDRVTHIELIIDGRSYAIKRLSDPTDRGIASFLVDTTQIGNGGHNILIKVFSGYKLVGSTSGGYTIGNRPVDVLPPAIKFLSIKKGSVVSGTTAVRLMAKDESGDDPLVSVFIDKSLKMVKNTAPYDYTWNTREYENGRHTLTACAYDGSGNKGEAQSVELVVRNESKDPSPIKPNSDLVPLSSTDNSSMKVRTTEPLLPVEQKTRETASRTVEPAARVTMPASRPSASRESIKSQSIDKPTVIARATEPSSQPIVPVVRSSASVTSPSGVSVAHTPKPVVVAVAPEMRGPSTIKPQMPRMDSDWSAIAPNATMPSRVPSHSGATVIAQLPEDMSAPAQPSVPSMGAATATPASGRVSMGQQRVRRADVSITLGQKLAKPELPSAEPIRMAMTPRQQPVKMPPSLEPRKVSAIVVQTTSHRRAVVTELRHAIAAGGGGIISWNNKTKTVRATFGGKKVSLQVGKPVAIVGEKNTKLLYSPYINESGRTMVDVRLLRAVLGAKLELDKKTQQAKLTIG